MRRLLRFARWRRDERGAVAVMTALTAIIMLGFAGLAIDVGSVFLQARKLQGMVDIAALAAARDLSRAQAAADANIAPEGFLGPVKVAVTLGDYRPDPKLKADERFQPGAAAPNAVSVTATGQAPLYFAKLVLRQDSFTIHRTATAARAEVASFSIGSRLASLEGGLANDLLSSLTGSQVKLSVMDYDALADADVDLLQFSDALRTSADVQAASFSDALDAKISTGKAVGKIADLLDAQGHSSAGAAARKIASAAGTGQSVKLGDLIDLGPYGGQDHVGGGGGAGVAVNAMDLAEGVLSLAQQGRQVKLDLGASLPGLADVDVWLAVGERPNNSPWLAVDEDGDVTIRTAQTRLYVEAKLLSALSGLGVKPVRLPVFVEVASAEAKLADIDCAKEPSLQSATLKVRPSIGTIAIADIDVAKLNDFKTTMTLKPAQILAVPLISVSGSSSVKLGGLTWKDVKFARSDIDGGVVKRVGTGDLLQATVTTLLGDLNLTATVGILPIGITGGLLKGEVAGLLSSVAAPLDQLVNSLTDLLGVRIGEADVRVNGLRCKDAALVA